MENFKSALFIIQTSGLLRSHVTFIQITSAAHLGIAYVTVKMLTALKHGEELAVSFPIGEAWLKAPPRTPRIGARNSGLKA